MVAAAGELLDDFPGFERRPAGSIRCKSNHLVDTALGRRKIVSRRFWWPGTAHRPPYTLSPGMFLYNSVCRRQGMRT